MTPSERSPRHRNTEKRRRQRWNRLRRRSHRDAALAAVQRYFHTLHTPGEAASQSEKHTGHILKMMAARLRLCEKGEAPPLAPLHCGAFSHSQQRAEEAESSTQKRPHSSTQPKLREKSAVENNLRGNSRSGHPLIVLYQPEIPPNTGTIARLCAAFRLHLVLIGPLGFDVTEKSFRRAGLDYWPHVDLQYFENWDSFLAARLHQRLVFVETSGEQDAATFSYQPEDALVFGSETTGLPSHVMQSPSPGGSEKVRILMCHESVRSINLSNCVSIVASHALCSLRTL